MQQLVGPRLRQDGRNGNVQFTGIRREGHDHLDELCHAIFSEPVRLVVKSRDDSLVNIQK